MSKKITIIGAGFVGSTAAYALLAKHVADEISLIDINEKLVNSQVMDLQHSVPFFGLCKIKAGTYDDIKNSQVVVMAAGVSQKPGQTRFDLVKQNARIIRDITPKIFSKNPKVILLMVTNPVDILTYLACSLFPQKEKQIIGSGTVLDSARFRFLLGEYFKINPQSIHAYIVGEHGDSEVPLLSTATIGNMPITRFKNYSKKAILKIFEKAKNAAYSIIEGKQATYYAIGAGIAQICQAILHNENRVLPLSHLIHNQCGISDVALSLPTVLGDKGIVQELIFDICPEEMEKLKESAAMLKKVIKKNNIIYANIVKI
ncbi:MAG: L-lactate dehydrogenase [Patescibacteria group bacterium]